MRAVAHGVAALEQMGRSGLMPSVKSALTMRAACYELQWLAYCKKAGIEALDAPGGQVVGVAM